MRPERCRSGGHDRRCSTPPAPKVSAAKHQILGSQGQSPRQEKLKFLLTKGGESPPAAALQKTTTSGQRWLRPGWEGQREGVIASARPTSLGDHPGWPARPLRWVLLQDPPERLDPPALLGSDLQQSALPIVSWLGRRGPVTGPFQQGRRTLGAGTQRLGGTQRPWGEPARARTTPSWLALLSGVTWLADRLVRPGTLPLPPEAG
jgi:hypothetical protein